MSDAFSAAGTGRRALRSAAGEPDAIPDHAASLAPDWDEAESAAALAWQMVRWTAPHLSGSESVALQALIVRLLAAEAEGSTQLELTPDDVRRLDSAPSLVAVVGDDAPPGDDAPVLRRPLVRANRVLTTQALWACERRLAQALAARLTRPPGWLGEGAHLARAAEEAVITAQPRLNPEQAQAVRAALQRAVTVVSGGPGTGKTTTALTIVRAFLRAGLQPSDVTLAAPTGKAAQRLTDALTAGLARLEVRSADDENLARTLRPAETLHRLLGYVPRAQRFLHHAANPLRTRLCLIDESSMVDLFLMDRLLAALPTDATLVLLGDADQLPSVAAGAVLRDLAPYAVRLGTSHRADARDPSGAQILAAARAIQAGSRAGLDAAAGHALRVLPSAARAQVLDQWLAERLVVPRPLARAGWVARGADGAVAPEAEARLTALARHHQTSRILCVTQGRPTGARAVNAWVATQLGGAPERGYDVPLRPGDPVMMLRNDYQRGLWNGDQGLVIAWQDDRRAHDSRALAVAFPHGDRWVTWPLEPLRDHLTHAYALTVHKAQGSEHDAVLVLLPDEVIPLVTRELLYTALTRARRTAWIVGPDEVLTAAIARPLARASGLAQRLERLVPRGAPDRA